MAHNLTLTHTNIETDLEKAKDGRWVLLVGGEPDKNYDEWPSPPAVVARWDHFQDLMTGQWRYSSYDAGYFGEWLDPIGFVELSDLGLYSERLRASIAQLDAGLGVERELIELENEDDSYIDVSSDGTSELVHPDGTRKPAPEGWEDESALRAKKIKSENIL